MQTANQSSATSDPSRANGDAQLHEFFALTDEQILEIDPEPQDVYVTDRTPESLPASVNARPQDGRLETGAANDPARGVGTGAESTQSAQTQDAQASELPAWLAETMNDPQRGAEARALWEASQQANREVASYREVFAKPEEARVAAERARALDDIDRAYFGGDAAQRSQLATMMLREDPVAFREMVFAGLRALEEAGKPIHGRSVTDALTQLRTAAPDIEKNIAATAQQNTIAQHRSDDSAQHAHLAAYAVFEKAANEELERSVGGAIERTLEQALPAAGRADGAALKSRIAGVIRQDIETKLQSDRQLGEQVAQILSAKQLDPETRAQVVRLIGERAQQLIPVATRRALNEWTQTTLAAHRGKSAHPQAASGRESPTAAPVPRDLPPNRNDAARVPQSATRPNFKNRVNYGKLSDEQILEL
ncbi:MAG TPA: hypothetical protein VMI32_17175 [Candidatus Solibacter sp.]|nr:hypothetical protein [Candidatus Solibacter sp.]